MDSCRITAVNLAGTQGFDGQGREMFTLQANVTPAAGGATAANQATEIASLASIDGKTPASPATAGNQTTGNNSLASIDTKLTAPVLGAGSALIGKVGIDQTTPGTTNAVSSTGNVASGGADSGNPVKFGGRNNTTLPTLADGQRGDAQMGTRGSINVTLMIKNSAGEIQAATPGDAQSNSQTGLLVSSFGQVFNGVTWDRQRGDANGTNVQSAMAANGWKYVAASGGIVNTTTAVTIAAAAGASVRNYLRTLMIDHDPLGAQTEWAIRDGAAGTVLMRGRFLTNGTETHPPMVFDPPLKGSANTLMEFVTLTAVTGGVYVNAEGFTGV